MLTCDSVINDLKKLGSLEKAKAFKWFFKTGKGEYGEGDLFFGVPVPEQRAIAKKYFDLSLKEIEKLLKNKIHECRLTALFILVLQYKQSLKFSLRSNYKKSKDKDQLVKFYLANSKFINNWDLVDSSASYILGDYLLDKDRLILYKLSKSDSLWDRRIAIISTYAFIRESQFNDTLKISEILIKDKQDLIHKAVGWMLREVGKRNVEVEEKFLEKYTRVMPRTMLRYAIEKFPEEKRKGYLNQKGIER